jgi:hypothetical protein
MSRVRFATAQALFDTFPETYKKISAKPTDQFPIDFLKGLVSQGKFEDALTFCAYLLPRREAVWWACGCIREFLGDIPQSQAAGLLAAEAWVYSPDEENRAAAAEIGAKSDSNDPMTWLALGAGWSGGMIISHPQVPVPAPLFMTARAVSIAILLAVRFFRKKDELPTRLQACIAEGIRLAENGLA